MTDPILSIWTALAMIGWVLAITLLTVMWATGDLRSGITAIVVAAAAATLNVRAFMAQHFTKVRDAFDIGASTRRMERVR